ncbi:MAG: hypothetical protein JO072_11430 [Parafilimonas sp.]|nr:hypothetical protein [Parafilimonas sp.]
MVSFFRERSAAAVFWLIIICFGLHVYSLVHSPQVVTAATDGFFYYLLNPLKNADPFAVSLLYVSAIFLLSLQLNFILNNLRMLNKPSYTPALCFILFSALLPAFNVVNAALLSCFLVIWILYSACKLYAARNAKTSIYNFGLLTGLCIILYYPSAPLIIIAMLALAIIRPFNINEWFVLFFGIITPVYFLTAYLFLTDQLYLLPSPQELFGIFKLPVMPLMTITLIVALVIAAWGILAVQNSGANVLIQVRKSWSVFLVAFLFTIPVIFFVKDAFPAVFLVVAVPTASYAGFAFAGNRNIIPVIFFWVLIALSVYNNWFVKY